MKAVIGGTGQLGAAFCRLLGAGALPLSRSQLDLSAIDSIEPAIAGLEVDTVINCAGYTAVDRAEAEADAAMAINSAAVGELARVCDSLGKRFVTFSTDYVFDGVKTSPYVESDVPNPLSVYGHTKLAGERLALAVNPETLVVRASWLLSGTHANFAATMLRLIAAGEVRVVDDQVGHPTLVDDLAPAVMACIEAGVTGVLHRTNQGTASWFQLARECAEIAALDVSRVVPCATEDLPRPAVRPSNSVLDSERATDVARLPHYRPGLERAIAQLLAR